MVTNVQSCIIHCNYLYLCASTGSQRSALGAGKAKHTKARSITKASVHGAGDASHSAKSEGIIKLADASLTSLGESGS